MYGSLGSPVRDVSLSKDALYEMPIRRAIFLRIYTPFIAVMLFVGVAILGTMSLSTVNDSRFKLVQYEKEQYHSIRNVDCDILEQMKLACRVSVDASAQSRMFLEYTPVNNVPTKCSETVCGSTVISNTLRSKDLMVGKDGTASVDIFRLRPGTAYGLQLYVYGDGEQGNVADNTTFVTKKTGYMEFDKGPMNQISGTPDYPLLMFPLHSDSFRGVIVTDSSGFLVWYYNTSAANIGGSHIEAAEQSHLHHVFCINDQGDEDGDGAQVSIIDALGTKLAVHENEDTRVTGHECRFVDGETDGEMSKRVLTLYAATSQLKDGSVEGFVYEGVKLEVGYNWNEAIRIFSADDTNGNLKIEDNITLANYVSFKTMVKFYDASKISKHWAWNNLVLEFGDTALDGIYSMRYIHASSVCMSDDGSLYVVTFRDTAVVVGIYKSNHKQRFLLSSLIPDIATHEFQNQYHKFYTPHDASFYGNNTVCLMDDGLGRPEGSCSSDQVKTCMSRAVCYTLNDKTKVVDLDWEFEYTHEFNGGPMDDAALEADLYNMNGGSLRRIGDEKWTVSYTAAKETEPYNSSSFVFGLKQAENHSMEITSIVRLPKCHKWSVYSGTSGSYRANPIESINGERIVG